MIKHNYLQKDYTINEIEKQLKIPFEIELKIEKSDPVIWYKNRIVCKYIYVCPEKSGYKESCKTIEKHCSISTKL